MVLASSNAGSVVLDPFAGSGTTLRVCQQLNRVAVGIELSEQYVLMIKERLKKPFSGFDSIDPRMHRVPLDLRKKELRVEYLRNHVKWFLQNHENALEIFKSVVESTYGFEAIDEAFGKTARSRTASSYSALSFSEQLEII
jgi:site-specific DNA-methyltransferase (adenine-specific)